MSTYKDLTEARVILDSLSPTGARLTTIQCTFPRLILAEVNTHRDFSKNGASSRAIPFEKRVDQVLKNPFVPEKWPLNGPGMQAHGYETNPPRIEANQSDWLYARNEAIRYGDSLRHAKVHKQITSRLLEPWMWHTHLISSTKWGNFLEQRSQVECYTCGGVGALQTSSASVEDCYACKGTGLQESLAQWEFVKLGNMIRTALAGSTPQRRDWHLPYISDRGMPVNCDLDVMKRASVACCAGLSYLTQEEELDIPKLLDRYDRLESANPPHRSPFEHTATSIYKTKTINYEYYGGLRSNYNIRLPDGSWDSSWTQFRHLVFGEGK